jgi:hypothetical protein
MISVSSTAGVFDSPRFLRTIRRRIMGRWRLLVFPGAPLLVVVLVALSILLVMALPPDYRLAAMAAFLLLSLGCGAAVRRFVTRKMRQEWFARGVPAEVTSVYSIRPEGLQVESEVATTLIRWPFINEVMLVDGHWLLISAVFGLDISRTSFRSDAEEEAFLTALFAHLDPAARARSQAAEKLLQA